MQRKKLNRRLLKKLLRRLPWLNMKLKWPDLKLNKRRQISRMQRTSNLFNRRLRLMPLKSLQKRKNNKRKTNFSKQTRLS